MVDNYKNMARSALVCSELVEPGQDLWYLVRDGEILTSDDGGLPGGPEVLADHYDAGGDEAMSLGRHGGVGRWALGIQAETPPPEGWRWTPLLALGAELAEVDWAVAGRAVQLVEWARTSRYCGRCGTPCELVVGERAMRCPACCLVAYPRLAPAVIVLVRRGDEALLARNRRFRGATFSTVAGFVEPGETLEEAVRREVAEEVGVGLGEITYFSSQPWPFPHSLMIGFVAQWHSGEIEVDGEEIVEARWFRADHLPDLPPPVSIARRLIEQWRAEIAGLGRRPTLP